MGKYDEALADFDRAIELDESPDNLELLVDLYDEMDEWNKVVEVYKRIIELNPSRPYTYYNYGLKLFKHRHIDKAVEHFLRRIELSPETAIGAYIYLGIIYVHMNQLDQASSSFNTADVLIHTSSGRNLYDASTYNEMTCLINLFYDIGNVLDQWNIYLTKFHHTENEIQDLIQLLQFLLESSSPPTKTEKVLSMARIKQKEIENAS